MQIMLGYSPKILLYVYLLMVSQTLQKKIDRAIKLLQSAGHDGRVVEVAYSGGKDSDVILQLAKESGINFIAIHKLTTIDPPGTLKHVREMGVSIKRPKYSFFQLVAMKGQPSRLRRFCCSKLKEYPLMMHAVIGVRAEESSKRAKRYVEPTACRAYSKTSVVQQYFPILDWTLDDIVQFAEDRGLRFAPVYYDADGVLHPERRLGCMCCPLASRKHRIEEFSKYPGMVRLYVRAIQRYIDAHPTSKMASTYTACEAFAHDVFFSEKGEWEEANHPSMFGDRVDWKEFLEKKFNIKL